MPLRNVIQAEGTAYVVSKALGIEAKSFDYLALYDADYTRIMENLQAIADAAKQILSGLKAPFSSGNLKSSLPELYVILKLNYFVGIQLC